MTKLELKQKKKKKKKNISFFLYLWWGTYNFQNQIPKKGQKINKKDALIIRKENFFIQLQLKYVRTVFKQFIIKLDSIFQTIYNTLYTAKNV